MTRLALFRAIQRYEYAGLAYVGWRSVRKISHTRDEVTRSWSHDETG
ncbi:hypothetical protein HMPREF1587_01643 [Bifidobacterium breve JCP7499]|nr:hypothetical protein HMPREF1587_01643 [Bifidobacterium breve JCP7499]